MTIADPITPQLRLAPKQSRALTTLDHLTDAAQRVLDRVGPDYLTTGDVAEEAGVSIGTVYRYFEDRVAILDVLQPHRHTAPAEANRIVKELAGYLEQTQINIIEHESGRPWTATDQLSFIEGALQILVGGDGK